MKLLGKLYLDSQGFLIIHSRADGKFYYVESDGDWTPAMYGFVQRSWRLIGDSYAKD